MKIQWKLIFGIKVAYTGHKIVVTLDNGFLMRIKVPN